MTNIMGLCLFLKVLLRVFLSCMVCFWKFMGYIIKEFSIENKFMGYIIKEFSIENISSHLSPWESALFEFFPPFIRKQLLLHPESDDSCSTFLD
ncbi:unnamed protein product [Urochloa humidicola]